MLPFGSLPRILPRYVYLPRLTGSQVLLNAIVDGLRLLTWERESFAFADSYESAGRYRGLRYGVRVSPADVCTGVLVKPEAAHRQIEAEIPNRAPDNVVRILTENGRTLKFSNQGFEKE